MHDNTVNHCKVSWRVLTTAMVVVWTTLQLTHSKRSYSWYQFFQFNERWAGMRLNVVFRFLCVKFLLGDAMHKRGLCRRAVSVCHIHVFCPNQDKCSRTFFTIWNIHHSVFFQTKPYGNIPSNAGVVGKNYDCRRIAGYGSMTAAVRTTTATVHRAVYGTDRHASVNLYHHHVRPWRREQNGTI